MLSRSSVLIFSMVSKSYTAFLNVGSSFFFHKREKKPPPLSTASSVEGLFLGYEGAILLSLIFPEGFSIGMIII
jgi:hypothetical protein